MQETLELKVYSIAEIVGVDDVGIIVLHDNSDLMQIVVICDNYIKHELGMRFSKKKECNTMLPEVLVNILKRNVEFHYEIIINDIVDGVYRATIKDTLNNDYYPLRAADAVLFHAITRVPLKITKQLMMRQAVPVNSGTAMALPYNALTDDMLHTAMDAAVKTERYELASTIRDELRKRGKQ